jgi:hypothetical protein
MKNILLVLVMFVSLPAHAEVFQGLGRISTITVYEEGQSSNRYFMMLRTPQKNYGVAFDRFGANLLFTKTENFPVAARTMSNRALKVTGKLYKDTGVLEDYEVIGMDDFEVVPESTVKGTVKSELGFMYFLAEDGRRFGLQPGLFKELKTLKKKTCTLQGSISGDFGEYFVVDGASCS